MEQRSTKLNSIKTWLDIWSDTKFEAIPLWSDLCGLVYVLLRLFIHKDFRGKVLEAGSGSGYVSLRMAREGARVILLDVSSDAIKFSRDVFKRTHTRAEGFVVGDIFHLPFRGNGLDAVWNSGVLEHFTAKEIKEAIDEALRILKEGGRFVMILPNREAYVYNIFRKLDMKLGRWRFGYEEPLSPEELYLFPLKPIAHRSAGLFYQFHFISLPLLGVALNVWLAFVFRIFPVLAIIDKRLPGYLIAGLWKR